MHFKAFSNRRMKIAERRRVQRTKRMYVAKPLANADAEYGPDAA